jgi:hypothetical protein
VLTGTIGMAWMGALAGPSWADELIVDNADPSLQIAGSRATGRTTPGFFGPDYLFHAPGHGAAARVWPFPAGASRPLPDLRTLERRTQPGRPGAVAHCE